MDSLDRLLDKINIFFREKRDYLLGPIIKFLNKMGISANFLSLSKIFFTVIYLLLIKNNFNLAVLFLLLGGILPDFFDGPLARYNKQDNDRGKFIDIFSDQIVYMLAIWGLMIIKISSPLILSYNIIIVGTFYLLAIIKKNENKKSDWIIKPSAKSNYYKSIFEISIILHLFLGMQESTFNTIIIVLNVIITIHFLYYLIKFAHKKYI